MNVHSFPQQPGCLLQGPSMEALGASERVISYLDAPAAPQIAAGAPLPSFSGHVRAAGPPSFPASQ